MTEHGKTALLSVSDRTGIVDFAKGLAECGWRILSSGGTAQSLEEADIPFEDVAELTGKGPELCGGRLRLVHPRLFAAVTADRKDSMQMLELESEGIGPVDLVAVNLYPIAQVLESRDLSQAELAEFLDISGSALLRAAARSFPYVITLCDPRDYQAVLETFKQGRGLTLERSQSLAAKAFYYISYYDSTAAQHLSPALEKLPDEMILGLKKSADLRYGENPQQRAALYSRSGARPWGLNAAEVLFGKPLHYNHYLGMDRALELVAEFRRPACAIVKHANPAGAAEAERLGAAAKMAYTSDPAGCTGGVAAFNREVDEEAARNLAPEYLECVTAPEFSGEALSVLREKKDIRLVRMPSLLLSANETDIRSVSGGVLIQDKDNPSQPLGLKTVTKRPPTEVESASLDFAWRVCKHTASHAAVLAHGTAALGIGGGQVTRMDAVRLALVKSQERHPVVTPAMPLVLASDGPMSPGNVTEAAENGVSAVIQSGGSSEDREAVARADEAGIAMVFTGMRHFRH